MKLIDRALLFFYTIVALLAPLDAALLLPPQLFPEFLLPIEPWLARKYGSYLAGQKPGFFLALVWLEVVFQWPLAILNLYGIWGRRSWVRTTCLVHGVSYATAMIAVSTELMETSHRASDKLEWVSSSRNAAVERCVSNLLSPTFGFGWLHDGLSY